MYVHTEYYIYTGTQLYVYTYQICTTVYKQWILKYYLSPHRRNTK